LPCGRHFRDLGRGDPFCPPSAGSADIVVAFAPGEMDAMLALALTLHIDPILSATHHLSRFVFVTIATTGSSIGRTAAGNVTIEASATEAPVKFSYVTSSHG